MASCVYLRHLWPAIQRSWLKSQQKMFLPVRTGQIPCQPAWEHGPTTHGSSLWKTSDLLASERLPCLPLLNSPGRTLETPKGAGVSAAPLWLPPSLAWLYKDQSIPSWPGQPAAPCHLGCCLLGMPWAPTFCVTTSLKGPSFVPAHNKSVCVNL